MCYLFEHCHEQTLAIYIAPEIAHLSSLPLGEEEEEEEAKPL